MFVPNMVLLKLFSALVMKTIIQSCIGTGHAYFYAVLYTLLFPCLCSILSKILFVMAPSQPSKKKILLVSITHADNDAMSLRLLAFNLTVYRVHDCSLVLTRNVKFIL